MTSYDDQRALLGDPRASANVTRPGYPAVAPMMSVDDIGFILMDDPEHARPYFRKLRELRDATVGRKLPGISMDVLSMGMSHDFEVAIEEGSTCVRVGTAIFGERP